MTGAERLHAIKLKDSACVGQKDLACAFLVSPKTDCWLVSSIREADSLQIEEATCRMNMGGYKLMSMKGKKKFRSWGYQNHLISSVDKMLYCNLNESEKIILSNENMITGQELDERDVLKNWQEFVVTRQEHLENKLESGALSSEQLHIWKKLDELLKEQPGEISDTITRLVLSSTYMHYNKGFFDGMKLATIMGNL